MAWTDERIETLKRRWKEGASLTEIGTELDVTRGAISGKLFRLGVFKSAEGYGERRARRPKKPKKKRECGPYKKRWTPEPIEPPDTEIEIAMTHADEDIQVKQRKTLMQLTEHTCKWPVGDPGTPEFFFCGGKAFSGEVYCGPHCMRAYQMAPRSRAWGRIAARR